MVAACCIRYPRSEINANHKGYPELKSASMAKYLAQLIILGGQAVGKAFGRALRQEYQATMNARKAAEEAGRSGAQAAKASTISGMQLDEAKQILNIDELDDIRTIQKNYEHLFKINAKSEGGSFYLQSKVYRAQERIAMELGTDIATPTTGDSDTATKQDS